VDSKMRSGGFRKNIIKNVIVSKKRSYSLTDNDVFSLSHISCFQHDFDILLLLTLKVFYVILYRRILIYVTNKTQLPQPNEICDSTAEPCQRKERGQGNVAVHVLFTLPTLVYSKTALGRL
jgi:hypothetical protein